MANTIRELTCNYIESIKDELCSLVDFLYENPETSFSEEKACSYISNYLKSKNFNVDMNVCEIKNSFIARYGKGLPSVAYICEYDSVEGIGHACGHNITSAIGVGAGCGLKYAIDKIGGQVTIIGCPAEERDYAKIKMYEKGLFSSIDAIICGHAMNKTSESGSSLGMNQVRITYNGKSSHSSLNANSGINALIPCINLFNLVNSISSRYTDVLFINGIIDKGGESIETIPSCVQCTFMIKSQDVNLMHDIKDDIIKASEFFGSIFKCTTEICFPEVEYLPLNTHKELSKVACHNLKERGIENIHGPITVPASLDIGNLSYTIPVIQPYIGITKEPIEYYTKEFSESTINPYAKDIMIKASCALSLTGVDIIQNPEIIKKVAL